MSKAKNREFHFSISVPLELKLARKFDAKVEKLCKPLEYVVTCGGGGTDGCFYDYSMYVECQHRDEAEKCKKALRKATWEWCRANWDSKMLLRDVAVSAVTEIRP